MTSLLAQWPTSDGRVLRRKGACICCWWMGLLCLRRAGREGACQEGDLYHGLFMGLTVHAVSSGQATVLWVCDQEEKALCASPPPIPVLLERQGRAEGEAVACYLGIRNHQLNEMAAGRTFRWRIINLGKLSFTHEFISLFPAGVEFSLC